MTSSKEEFKPINGKRVKMYVCGITPYDSPHMGNLRTFIFFDVVAKYLRASGYEVFYLQNITDIDDKIITRANETSVLSEKLSSSFMKEYMESMRTFSIDSVSLYARATYHINEIIEQIKILEEKGYTYKLEDGIYFRISKFKDYGKLSGQNTESLRSGLRATVSEDKENQGDFVLWKFKKPGEPFWKSPWGEGRPGWNIEDTAITKEYFGDVYDLHGGGVDLIFPHHEGEIAIMRSISNKDRLSNFWMHTGMLTLNGQKMSKSLNNFLVPGDLLKDYSAAEIRYAMLSSQYRSIADFSMELLKESRVNLNYIKRAIRILEQAKGAGSGTDFELYNERIKEFMDDDFNTRGALRSIMDIAEKVIEKETTLSREEATKGIEIIKWADSFLSIIFTDKPKQISSETVEILLSIRENLRMKKLFKESDDIRKALKESGVTIEDKKDGSQWFYE
jgi:cysteinyl-tRNA synthetase